MWEKARVGRYEKIELKYVYYHMENTWPVQIQRMKLVLWDNPEGWGGEGGGRGVQDGGTHLHPWLIHVMYGKNRHNIVK